MKFLPVDIALPMAKLATKLITNKKQGRPTKAIGANKRAKKS